MTKGYYFELYFYLCVTLKKKTNTHQMIFQFIIT